MKKNLLLFVLLSVFSFYVTLNAQCGYGTPTVAATVAAPTTVGATITSQTMTDNQVYRVTGIVAGAVYRVYNCGSGYDTQITIFPSGGGTSEEYNDDNGPECTGAAASINYAPTVAGTKDIKLQRYNCSTLGYSNGTITVRLVSAPAASCTYTVPASGSNSINTCSGTICDPGGTGNYLDNQGGYTVINPTAGNLAQITGVTMATELNYDFVRVYDGMGTGGTLLFSSSGSTLIPQLTSSTGPLTIQFTSDGSVPGPGFSATISCVAAPCNYTVPSTGNNAITTCSGTICDPGGTGDYLDNQGGYTVINPTAGNLAQITGVTMATELNYDFVRVYDGMGTGGTLLFNSSGSTLIPQLTSSTGPLTIQFTSDGSVPGPGFSATISCIPAPTCSTPTSAAATSITTTTATANWTCASCTGTYIIEYGLTGFTPGTGATAGSGSSTVVTSGSGTTSLGLSLLTSGSTYQYYVRQVCSGPLYSSNSTVQSFTTLVPPPANDNVCSATPLAVTGTSPYNFSFGPYSNANSTTEVGEPAPPLTGFVTQTGWGINDISNTIWFALTVPACGLYSIETDNFDTQIALYSVASCGAVLAGGTTLLAANDDETGSSPYDSKIIDVALQPGVTYYLQLDSYTSGVTGSTPIKVTGVASAIPAITSASAVSPYVCPGATTTLNAIGVGGDGAVVTWWTGMGGTGTNLGTGTSLPGMSTGTYYARVTGNCSPAAEASVTVGTLAAPAISSVTAGTNPICVGSTTTLTAIDVAGDGAAVTWRSAPNGGGISYGTGPTLSGVGAGTYYAYVTGDCSPAAEAFITITTLAVPSISSISALANPVCEGTTTTLTVNSFAGDGAVVNWYSSPNGVDPLGVTGTTYNNAGSGTYYARVTGTCSPAQEASIVITETITPAPTGAATQTFCGSGTIAELVATGSGLKWYDMATGGTEYTNPGDPLVHNNHYYASQTSSGCESASRLDVTVAINTPVNYYADNDMDSYGDNAGSPTSACVQPVGQVANNTDCNDAAMAINPGAPEICNSGTDDDCDTFADDNDPSVSGQGTYYADNDSDTYGTNSGAFTAACIQPGGTVTNNLDCNDAVFSINPLGTETCAPGDEDCDNLVNDNDPTVTGQGTYYADNDGDSYGAGPTVMACLQGSLSSNALDCDDTPVSGFAINPDATETCAAGDEDCDGLINDADSPVTGQGIYYTDTDGDGYGAVGSGAYFCLQGVRADNDDDCDDNANAINPTASEICNTLDDDCDSQIDEGLNIVPTTPATYTSATLNQTDGSVNNYTAACSVLASITDAAGGNVLGNTTVTSVLSLSVPLPNSGGYIFGRRKYTINATSTGPAVLKLYFTQADFDDYNSNNNTFLDLPTSGNNSHMNKPYFRIARVSGTAYAISGPLGDFLTWNSTDSRWEVDYTVTDVNADYYFVTMPSCDGILVNNLQATQIQGSSIVATWDNLVTLPTNGWYGFQYRTTSPVGNWIDAGTANGGAITKFMIGFLPGTAYELQIRRHCSSQSTGPWSSSVLFSTPSPGCSSPPMMTATMIHATGVTVTWPTIMGAGWYEFRYSSVSASGPWTSAGTSGGSTTSKIISGLLPGTNYFVQGRTFCASNGQPSEWGLISFTTPEALGCALPPVLTASIINATNITISWPIVTGAGWFEFRYRLSPSGSWITAGTLTGTAVSRLFGGLTPGTAYDIQARTFCVSNGQASAWGNITVSTLALNGCELPPVLTATIINATNITVGWPAISGAGWYEFRYRLSPSGSWVSGGTLGGSAVTKVFSGLTPSTAYDIQARTFCTSNGQASAWSNITVTTIAIGGCELPPVLSVGTVISTKATVTWPLILGAGWFEFRFSTSPTGPWMSGGTVGGSATSKLITGLSPATTYYVQARTFCANGLPSAWSENVTFTTLGTALVSQPSNEMIGAEVFTGVEVEDQTPDLTILAGDHTSSEVIEAYAVSALTLYPNPTKHNLNVEFFTTESRSLTMFVMDMAGRVLQRLEVAGSTGINTIEINLEDLPGGMYMIQLRENERLLQVGKAQKLD